ncbi:MAG: hypothetical protein ABIP17_05445 [Ilumatobacteraceae bacterium]
MTRRLLFVVVSLLALSACRLDVTVDVHMDPDGTGIVTVAAVADADLVAQVPDLVEDLRLEDAVANGWTVDGPTEAPDGALSISLQHHFSSAEELANVLNSIGPPLVDMQAARTVGADGQTTNAVTGRMQLNGGFEAFADAALLDAVGGLPFADEFAATGSTPAESMSFTFRVSLPGELVSAETGTEVDDGVIERVAPLDGSSIDLLTSTVQRPANEGGDWARPVSTVAFGALLVWLVTATVFIGFVAVARRNKRHTRERALRHLR